MAIRAKVPIKYSIGFRVGYPVGDPFFWMRVSHIPFLTSDEEEFTTSEGNQFFVRE